MVLQSSNSSNTKCALRRVPHGPQQQTLPGSVLPVPIIYSGQLITILIPPFIGSRQWLTHVKFPKWEELGLVQLDQWSRTRWPGLSSVLTTLSHRPQVGTATTSLIDRQRKARSYRPLRGQCWWETWLSMKNDQCRPCMKK